MKIGYMRISTRKQETALQYDALIAENVHPDNIYRDVISGKTTVRDGLDECLSRLQSGDTLVVWRIDRLGRTVKHLVTLVDDLKSRGISFKSLMDPVDTTTASGELAFHIFCAMAHFERRLAQERIKAGIKAVRDAGRAEWGKPPARKYDPLQIMSLHRSGSSFRDIATRTGVSKNTVKRVVDRAA